MTEISIFEQTNDKYILDMTCGGRSIWFQKNHPNTIFFDRRDVEYEQTFGSNPSARHIRVHPDVMGDFRELPFEDNTFNLVVFDPPHIVGGGRALAYKGLRTVCHGTRGSRFGFARHQRGDACA